MSINWVLIGMVLFFKVGLMATLIPQELVDGQLSVYNQLDKDLIEKDLRVLKSIIFSELPGDEKWYVGTAGSPGSGKSTGLEIALHEDPFLKTLHCVYIDSDQRVLQLMLHTYRQSTRVYERSKMDSWETVLRSAYQKWRSASNYIANTFLNRAMDGGYNIAHGTTATSPYIGDFYNGLKQAGYKIYLQLYFSKKETCCQAVNYRNQEQRFIQSTDDDLDQKFDGFLKNMPIYFEYADHIDCYWMDEGLEGVPVGAKKVAQWTKQEKWAVFNDDGYAKMRAFLEEKACLIP
jgi:hypothetical protein